MRSLSRRVTVPAAASEYAPRTSSTLIELPGGKVLPLTSPSGVIAAAPPTPATGSSPFAANCGANAASDSWLIPLNTSGVAIGVICCPIKGISGEPVETGASSETDETAGFGRFGFQSVLASWGKEKQGAGVCVFVFFFCFLVMGD